MQTPPLAPPRRATSRHARALLAALALLGAPAATHAQGDPGDPLGALVREALRANLGLAQHRVAEERSGAVVRQARAMFLPNVTFDTRRSELSGVMNLGDLVNPAYQALNQLTRTQQFPTDVDASLPFAQETRVRVAQPLLAPQAAANYRLSRTLREMQETQTRGAARQLAADVQHAYLAWASAEQSVAVYRSTLPLVEENVRVNERLLEHGKVTPEALWRARAERAELAQQLAEASDRRDAARGAVNQLLARPLDAPLALVSDTVLLRPIDGAADAFVASARRAREELRQVDWAVRAADAQGRLAIAGSLPTVSLAVDYGMQGQDYRTGLKNDFYVASLAVSWNVFNGGQDLARRQQASLDAERLRLQRQELEQRIALQVRTAYDAAVVARRAIATAEERLTASRRTYELVRRRQEEGLATQIELVDARAAYTRAALNGILTRYAYASRWVDLERAAALRPLDD